MSFIFLLSQLLKFLDAFLRFLQQRIFPADLPLEERYKFVRVALALLESILK